MDLNNIMHYTDGLQLVLNKTNLESMTLITACGVAFGTERA